MTLRRLVEDKPIVWLLGAIVAAFVAGFSAYPAILEVSHFDVVKNASYIDRQEITTSHIEWEESTKEYVLLTDESQLRTRLTVAEASELQQIDLTNRQLINEYFYVLRAQAMGLLKTQLKEWLPN